MLSISVFLGACLKSGAAGITHARSGQGDLSTVDYGLAGSPGVGLLGNPRLRLASREVLMPRDEARFLRIPD